MFSTYFLSKLFFPIIGCYKYIIKEYMVLLNITPENNGNNINIILQRKLKK